ncbi:hypothetical protein ES703_15030 [subsurface metagenome]
MKCPLTTVISPAERSPEAKDWGDCIKEGCAWWDEEKNCCSLKVIAKELTRLQLSKK